MILKYRNAEGLEWLIKVPADTLEEAQAILEQRNTLSSNGSGPWEFVEIEHESAFPHEREPQS